MGASMDKIKSGRCWIQNRPLGSKQASNPHPTFRWGMERTISFGNCIRPRRGARGTAAERTTLLALLAEEMAKFIELQKTRATGLREADVRALS